MRIQHNIMAMNSYRNYTNNTSAVSKNLEKLSSGYKINNAGDDAAGLAVSEKMRAQITGLQTASKNAKDGISLVKTAEGALTEVHSMLNRMVDLAGQSANGTYDNEVDRANLNKEVTALKSEINRIADSSNFNGIKLLDGTQAGAKITTTAAVTGTNGAITTLDFTGKTGAQLIGATITVGDKSVKLVETGKGSGATDEVEIAANADGDAIAGAVRGAFTGVGKAPTGAEDAAGSGSTVAIETTVDAAGTKPLAASVVDAGLKLQIGDTADSYNQMKVGISDMHASALGIADIDISNQADAATAIDSIKNAINSVSSTRGDLGALQNRLDHTINNLSVMTENIQDAESTIRDTDIADEMMSYTKNNILVQSAQAMLAQANQVPQGVLQLLG